ncbi:hypothetical protein HDU87_003787 [Geranomyces variabilis]|uniref:SET domain-containing protein n=1 Tax=Geranomyces variabilis TaxID=109894 RepID=A0AAD5TJ20_9FUNG|nr:hypothetical protein HDU87_003787 [Geranomyces variabilis]
MIKDKPLVSYSITPALDTGDPADRDYVVTWLDSGDAVRVRSKNSTYHGKGLFCAQPCIPKGTLIDHYHGYTMTSAEAHAKFAANDDSFSLLSSDVVVPHSHIPGRFCNDSVILPVECDGPITYSCSANATFEQNNGIVVVRALSDIAEGEEIVIAYGMWYWRGILFERAGFKDAPSRFQCIEPTCERDGSTLKRWLKTLKFSELPDDLRLVKVARYHPDPTKRENGHFDYYLVRRGEMGVWRSAKQYARHMQRPDPEDPDSLCGCEVCQKKERANNAKRKRVKDDVVMSLATAQPTGTPLPLELSNLLQSESTGSDNLPVASESSSRTNRQNGLLRYGLKNVETAKKTHQALLAFGFDAFSQCSGTGVDKSATCNPAADAPVLPLATRGAVCLSSESRGAPYLGLAATFSCSLSWTATEIHIWGCTSLFTGEDSTDDAHLAIITVTEAKDDDTARIRKVIPVRRSPKSEHEQALLVLLNGGTLLLLAASVGNSKDVSLKRKRTPEQDQSSKDLRITLPTSIAVPFPCLDAAATSSYAAAILTDGTICTWELGTGLSNNSAGLFIPGSPSFSTISAGRLHFLALSTRNEVYTWGANGLNGQLGHGFSESARKHIPEVVEALQGLKVTGLAGGGWHSAAVTADGDIYTFGSGEQGQLGRDDADEVDSVDNPPANHALPSPVNFDFTSQNLSVVCGSKHTVVSDGKNVYACGWNKYGQVAPPPASPPTATATQRVGAFQAIELPADITTHKSATVKAVACGTWHTLVLVEWEEEPGDGVSDENSAAFIAN